MDGLGGRAWVAREGVGHGAHSATGTVSRSPHGLVLQHPKMVEAAGVERASNPEVAEITGDSCGEHAPRVGVSSGSLVAFGPADHGLARTSGEGLEAVETEVEGTPSATPPSLRDELAALVARAVREGDLGLARRLLGAAEAGEGAPSAVVDLETRRGRRR